MKPSVLHLEGYHIEELFLELNQGFAKKTEFGAWSGYHYMPEVPFTVDPVNFKVASETAKKFDDPFSLRYVLKIASMGRKDKVPYTFRISLVGYFHLDKEQAKKDEKLASVLLYANAPALLYAAARELLASATARGPYPAVILPSVSFLDDAEKLVEADNKLPSKRVGSIKKGGKNANTRKALKK